MTFSCFSIRGRQLEEMWRLQHPVMLYPGLQSWLICVTGFTSGELSLWKECSNSCLLSFSFGYNSTLVLLRTKWYSLAVGFTRNLSLAVMKFRASCGETVSDSAFSRAAAWAWVTEQKLPPTTCTVQLSVLVCTCTLAQATAPTESALVIVFKSQSSACCNCKLIQTFGNKML